MSVRNKLIEDRKNSIIEYLITNASSMNPRPMTDIVEAVGIVKSTGYRMIRELVKDGVLNAHATTGKSNILYSVDHDGLLRYRSKSNPAMGDLANSLGVDNRVYLRYVDASFKNKLLSVPWTQLFEGFNNKGFVHHLTILNQVSAKAVDYQNGVDNLTLDDISKCRSAVEYLMQYSAGMLLYLERLKTTPAYAIDDEFWTLWTKD